jgi:hypothetical protein
VSVLIQPKARMAGRTATADDALYTRKVLAKEAVTLVFSVRECIRLNERTQIRTTVATCATTGVRSKRVSVFCNTTKPDSAAFKSSICDLGTTDERVAISAD